MYSYIFYFPTLQVLNAQAAGYKLVIVFDYKQEGPFKMGSATDDDDPHPPVEIPLVRDGESEKHGKTINYLYSTRFDGGDGNYAGPCRFATHFDLFPRETPNNRISMRATAIH